MKPDVVKSQSVKSHASKPAIDPITAEVVSNALIAFAEEMTINLARTAHSTIVYEVQDFCTGLVDPQARLIAQPPGGLPLFVGDLDAAIADGLAVFEKEGFSPGDVIVTNHTGTCGHHLNNIVVYTPAFHDGKLIGFPATRAHWTDVGGRLAGGFLTDAVSSFEEGLQIRSVKLFRGGVPDEGMFRILRHNIRDPEGSFGDLRAQIAACRLGERRLQDLFTKYGADTVHACIALNWDQSERMVREEIAKFPDGVYEAESFLDDDGVERGKPVPIRVRVTVRGDAITMDFSKMSPQVRGPINCGPAAGRSAARLALKYLVAPHLGINHGCFRPLEVILPLGTLISAREPAAMSWWQTPILTVIDTVLKAMSQAAPEQIPAAHYGNISSMLLTGHDPATGRQFTSIEPVAGGWGARPHGDGPSATYTIGHGDTFNVPVEVLETRFPVMIERYCMRTDSGGAGRYRGGLGLERVYRILDNGVFNGLSDRSYCPPWGFDGGKAASPGSISLRRKGLKASESFRKITGLRLGADDLLTFCTGGGGGYGDPLAREPERVAEDVEMGYVSASQAREAYGVVFKRGTTNVDAPRTDKLRNDRRAKAKRSKKPTRSRSRSPKSR
jgi:N-methylhydantoinase B